MKWFAVRYLKRRIVKAEKKQKQLLSEKQTILAHAYDHMINSYKGTLMFLEIDKN